jgi:hypothetical protein
MFCPKCAAQNLEGASFCRVCGANISLVSHALSGQLPQAAEADDSRLRRRLKRGKEVEPSLEKGIMNVFIGLGFIVAAMAIMLRFPGGIFWGWSFFFPGFSTLGRGVASIVAARRNQSGALPTSGNAGGYFPSQTGNPAPILGGASAPRTGELRQPVPSVTEGTTRHLGAEAPTRHLDD